MLIDALVSTFARSIITLLAHMGVPNGVDVLILSRLRDISIITFVLKACNQKSNSTFDLTIVDSLYSLNCWLFLIFYRTSAPHSLRTRRLSPNSLKPLKSDLEKDLPRVKMVCLYDSLLFCHCSFF